MAGFFIIFIASPIALIIVCVSAAANDWRFINSILRRWKIFLSIFGAFLILIFGSHFFLDKTNLERNDIFGQYVIDRDMFKGPNADWQYNHYRFEITKQDSFIFYLTNGNQINRTYRGKIYFESGYEYRINIKPKFTTDLIDSIPALYREPFSFYYVMSNTPYGNMFYKKGEWKPID